MAPLTGKRFATYQHPLYAAWLPTWRMLADAYEGTGGFADGMYLVAHPREWKDHGAKVKEWDEESQQYRWVWRDNPMPRIPTAKLKERRTLARYENWARKIVQAFSGALFRESPGRVQDGQPVVDAALTDFWADVDGFGTDVDDWWASIWPAVATFGHAYVYLDRAPADSNQEGSTAADTRLPFLRAYTPIDVIDWAADQGQLLAVKFLEPVPRLTLDDPVPMGQYRVRYVDTAIWQLYDQTGKLLDEGTHGIGVLPVVPVFAARRPLVAMVGLSLLGDPKLFQDYYNLISEHRELLRKQTFSITNVPLGSEGDIEVARALAGEQTGTTNILFSQLPAVLLSPSGENTAAYVDAQDKLLRAIFRLAGIVWEADTRDAEATGSLLVKREDLSTALSQYADEIEQAEYRILELFYRATKGPEAGQAAFDQGDVQIRYPDTFDVSTFQSLAQDAQAALGLGMPIEFAREVRKRIVDKALPDLPEDVKGVIVAAIEKQAEPPSPAELAQQAIEARVNRPFQVKAPLPGAQGGQ